MFFPKCTFLTNQIDKIGSDNRDLSLVLLVSLAMHRFFRYNLKGGNRNMVMYQCIHHTCILQTILLMLKIFQLISNYSAQSEQLFLGLRFVIFGAIMYRP